GPIELQDFTNSGPTDAAHDTVGVLLNDQRVTEHGLSFFELGEVDRLAFLVEPGLPSIAANLASCLRGAQSHSRSFVAGQARKDFLDGPKLLGIQVPQGVDEDGQHCPLLERYERKGNPQARDGIAVRQKLPDAGKLVRDLSARESFASGGALDG